MNKNQREIIILEDKINSIDAFIKSATVDQLEEVEAKEKELTLAEKKLSILKKEASEEEPSPKVSDEAAKTEEIVKDAEQKEEEKKSKVVEKSIKFDLEITDEIETFVKSAKGMITKSVQGTTTGGNNQKETIMPSVISKTIVEQATSGSSILSLISTISVAKWIEEIGGDPFVYKKVAEGTNTNNENTATTTTFKLENFKYAAGATLNNEVIKYSTSQFIDYFIARFALGFEKMLRKEIIHGDGNEGITGLGKAVTDNVIKKTTSAKKGEVTFNEMKDIILTLEDSDDEDAVFLMHKATWSEITNQVNKDGTLIWSDRDILSTKGSRMFKGYQVYLSSDMPKLTEGGKASIYFGNFSEFILNAPEGFSLEYSDDEQFSKDRRVYRSIAHLDGKVRRGEAFHAFVNNNANK